MGVGHGIRLLLGVASPFLAVLLLFFATYRCRNRSERGRPLVGDGGGVGGETREEETEELITFPGGEDLTVGAVLDAPGEVVGKSGHSTLYRAWLGGGPPLLLRFVRPACAGTKAEVLLGAQLLGLVRHPNLVPLRALYVGTRGEVLLVHPFLPAGTLFQFLMVDNLECHSWEVIHKLSMGIAKGLDHLHNGLQRPLIHGNLKSKNVLLDVDYQACLSDFGLHLLLNPSSGQEMLEASAAEGYKAPELTKMKDAGKESDIYSLGVIFLEMVTRKDTNSDFLPTWDLHLSNSLKNPVFDGKISEMISHGLLRQSREQNCITGEGLLMFLQLAIACRSPSPRLRPDIKQVLGKLEEIELWKLPNQFGGDRLPNRG